MVKQGPSVFRSHVSPVLSRTPCCTAPASLFKSSPNPFPFPSVPSPSPPLDLCNPLLFLSLYLPHPVNFVICHVIPKSCLGIFISFLRDWRKESHWWAKPKLPFAGRLKKQDWIQNFCPVTTTHLPAFSFFRVTWCRRGKGGQGEAS